jgi:hypothetical protein
VSQELKENEKSCIEMRSSFENEKIVVQISSPDRYKRKNQYFQRMMELQP